MKRKTVFSLKSNAGGLFRQFLEAFWKHFGSISGAFWFHFGRLFGDFGGLGGSWGLLGPPWEHLGHIMAPRPYKMASKTRSRRILGGFWTPRWLHVGIVLGRFSDHLFDLFLHPLVNRFLLALGHHSGSIAAPFFRFLKLLRWLFVRKLKMHNQAFRLYGLYIFVRRGPPKWVHVFVFACFFASWF